MRPVVHIGYHKTATTWFQKQVYPRAVSHRWIPRQQARQAFLDPNGLCFDAELARRQLADPVDRRPPLICEENLSGYIHNGGLHGLMGPEAARRIRQTFPDAVIVIVVRAQPQAIAASYIQYVRGGGTYGTRRYLFASRFLTGAFRHAYKAPHFAFEHFEYDRLVAYYDSLFGRENVLVLPYEALRDDPDAFLDYLEREAGIRLDRGAVRHAKSNRSFGLLTIAAGRLLGLFTARSVVDKLCLVGIPGFYELRRHILKLFSRFDAPAGPERVLGRRMVAYIRSRYAASNRRLALLRPFDFAALGYPMDAEAGMPVPAGWAPDVPVFADPADARQ